MKELSKLIENIFSQYEEFAIFETLKFDEDNYLSYIFFCPKDKLVLFSPEGIKKFFSDIEKLLTKGYYLAGFFSYELGYFLDYHGQKPQEFNFPLAFFYVFDKPIIYNHKINKFEDENLISENIYSECCIDKKFKIKNLSLNTNYDEYKYAIDKIKNYILDGDTYQVNYTIKAKFKLLGSIIGLYEKLKQTQKVSYSAFIKTKDFVIISFSPELFFRKQSDIITVKPMKGTIKRGYTIREDKILSKKLQTDIKNRAENVMIVDLLRNDLGKISSYGNVKVKKLFEIEKYETLFQMTSTIQARIDKDISLYKLFYSIFPSGSVTGAPKIRTMQIIKEVEKEPRKVYTGAVGFFTPQKDAVFNVAIRTILIEKNQAEMGIGSGIVYDSVAKDEFEECKLKSMFIFKTVPRFRLVETMLYCKNFDKYIDEFDGLKLKIDKGKFQYGFFLLNEHLRRLKSSAEYFEFKYDEEQILHKLLSLNLDGCYRVRLLLSKDGKIKVETSKFPCKNFCSSKKIGRIALVKTNINNNVFLFHKTTNRKLYNKYYHYFRNKGFFDVVFVNKDGQITEATRGNIFVKLNGMVYTPDVKLGLLDGVFRKYLLHHNKNLIKEGKIELEKLNEVQRVYYTNAVIGIREMVIEKNLL